MILFLLACGAGEAPVEALVVPEAPGESAMPVGVRTIDADGQRFELWYPAPEGTEGDSTEDFQQFVPQALLDHVGAVPFPTLSLGATRDAPVRNAGEPLPVVLFSHGLGGFRLQSFSFAAHLAARGHVVLAPDHPGRMMGDLLPCMFSPALEGCDLSGMLGEDPALEDLAAALTWIESAPEGFAFDTDRVALAGHSAGGGSTVTLGEEDERLGALLPMAGAGPVARAVPTLMMGATCDTFVSSASIDEAAAASATATSLQITAAGHLAFSDLCDLDLLGVADAVLADRDDLNDFIYEQLRALASDGCPAVPSTMPDCALGTLDLEQSDAILRHYSAAFLEAELSGTGPGVEAGLFDEVVLGP